MGAGEAFPIPRPLHDIANVPKGLPSAPLAEATLATVGNGGPPIRGWKFCGRPPAIPEPSRAFAVYTAPE